MVTRTFWLKKIEQAWQKKSVLWLSGVRRVGKTFLCRSLSEIEYFDCELPRARRLLEDSEAFLKDVDGCRIVLDEVHRLHNPSQLLKIASDYFPEIRVLATGSSTLGASTKFKDTLTGRKRNLWLTPMISHDLKSFRHPDLNHRLLRGGLPPFFLADGLPEEDFQEWVDAYWAKDIQEMFRLERRHSFQRFLELLLMQSGGIFEASKFAQPCEVSRTTISNYLAVLEATFVVHVIRPYSTHRPNEIVSAPKVYGFDTGFVCYYRGWLDLRQQDMGQLWEHYVLNEIQGNLQSRDILYWRDKRKHEIDFIYMKRGKAPIAIECKLSCNDFEVRNLLSFRHLYPDGENYVVSSDIERSFKREYRGVVVSFVNLRQLVDVLQLSR